MDEFKQKSNKTGSLQRFFFKKNDVSSAHLTYVTHRAVQIHIHRLLITATQFCHICLWVGTAWLHTYWKMAYPFWMNHTNSSIRFFPFSVKFNDLKNRDGLNGSPLWDGRKYIGTTAKKPNYGTRLNHWIRCRNRLSKWVFHVNLNYIILEPNRNVNRLQSIISIFLRVFRHKFC